MKVSLFLPNLSGGGSARVFALLAEGLAARGIDTEVVLVRAEGPRLAAVRAVMPVIDLDVGAMPYALLPLARYLRRRRPDVLVTALGHANIVAVWARWLARVPTAVVITNHLSLPRSTGPGAGCGSPCGPDPIRWPTRSWPFRVTWPRIWRRP